MKAFLSYGLNNTELYWLTILAKQLQEKGFDVVTPNLMAEKSYHGNINNIFASNLYIGLLTNFSDTQRILFEFNNAIRKIPSILLIEESIYNLIDLNPAFKINPKMRDYIIPLSSNDLDQSISLIQQKIEKVKKDINNQNLAWLIGGAALIALLISLNKNN